MDKPVIIDTKFGKLALFATSADHIYATTNPSGGFAGDILTWTIRGKEHKFVTAHLHQWSDGDFHIGEEKHKDNVYEQKHTGLYFTATNAARNSAFEEINRAVNAWVASHRPDAQGILHTAEVERLTTEIRRAEVERDKHQAEVERWTRELKALHVARGEQLDN